MFPKTIDNLYEETKIFGQLSCLTTIKANRQIRSEILAIYSKTPQTRTNLLKTD